jgi:hypothetical protein
MIAEPCAGMLYTAVFTGLRASELIGLKWCDPIPGVPYSPYGRFLDCAVSPFRSRHTHVDSAHF